MISDSRAFTVARGSVSAITIIIVMGWAFPPRESVNRRLVHRDRLGFKMNAWFDALSRRFADAARDQGTEIMAPELDPQVADEVLELARVAAHSKERRFAPLACFMAGVAVERVREGKSSAPIDEPAYLRTIYQSLEADSAAEAERSAP